MEVESRTGDWDGHCCEVVGRGEWCGARRVESEVCWCGANEGG